MIQPKAPFFKLAHCNLLLALVSSLPSSIKTTLELNIKDNNLTILAFLAIYIIEASALFIIFHYCISLLMRKVYQAVAEGLRINHDKAVANEMIACGVCSTLAIKFLIIKPEWHPFGNAFFIKTWLLLIITILAFFITQVAIVCTKQKTTIFQSILLVLIPSLAPVAIFIGIALLITRLQS